MKKLLSVKDYDNFIQIFQDFIDWAANPENDTDMTFMIPENREDIQVMIVNYDEHHKIVFDSNINNK